MKTPLVLLLCSFILMLNLGDAKKICTLQQKAASPASPASDHLNPAHLDQTQPKKVPPTKESTHENLPPQSKVTEPTIPPRVVVQPNPLVSQECLQKKFTRSSCAKVFCPPWQRCIRGQCVCKISNQCPRGRVVCGHNKRSYSSLCHAQAIACREKKAIFSHYGQCEDVYFKTELKMSGDHEVVIVNQPQTKDEVKYLICGTASWNMAAANVVCKDQTNDHRGAIMEQSPLLKDIPMWDSRPQQCMSVRCTGMEQSLAECVFYEPTQLTPQTHVATVKCYNNEKEPEECSEFQCVNNKCIWWNKTCDGIDDCGDYSDEMCCEGCSNGAFHCKSGVCISSDSLKDDIRDCLGGEDEMQPAETSDLKPITPNPKEDVQTLRKDLASKLYCGIPNMDYLNKTVEETRYVRTKRVVGGQEANPTQIQWQVAVQEDGVIHCGGAYLGGCWVLTAAHCVRPKPQAFLIKFSLWNKLSRLSTSDAIPVRNIIIHPGYDSRTYHNDIALIQLEELPGEGVCMRPNPAVRSVCVPWSPLLFPPSSSCTISGWGRNREGDFISTLKWAEVNIIGNCSQYYKTRFMDGMECAGDLTGSVDTCQGDSGGPLVCKDPMGVSYVWGIVSWGENCGEANHPGVYTKVADYFEWIRLQTGWPAVTKYNY